MIRINKVERGTVRGRDLVPWSLYQEIHNVDVYMRIDDSLYKLKEGKLGGQLVVPRPSEGHWMEWEFFPRPDLQLVIGD